ncbi:MAG: Nnf1-domain-containing protein [Linnemannia elongata]|nr:MAG: Nnf1-domain-containing protein [Linnemannia elongata]
MDMDLVHNDTEVDVMRQDPEPEPVVDAEPEEEGPRMTRLRGILSKSLQETLKACNYNAIQECFPILATTNPDELHEAHEKVCQFLKVEVENEFGQIIEERNVIFKLNGLDRLIADARAKGITAGSRTILDLSPDVVVRARTVPTKEAEIERLKAELEQVRQDNRRLGSALTHAKAEHTAIKFEILESYNQFQEGTKIASHIPINDMEELMDDALPHIQEP